MKWKGIYVCFVIFITSLCHSQETLTSSSNNFSFNFYKATRPVDQNYFISPLSLNLALAVTNEGAASDTRTDINRLLSLPENADLTALYSPFMKNIIPYQANDRLNTLYIANSLWINTGLDLDKEYRKKIEQHYNSQLFDFNRGSLLDANEQLKNWVSEKTENNIRELSELGPNTQLSIVNAIYLSGMWSLEFDKNKTKKDRFYNINEEKVPLDFMNQRSSYNYFENVDLQMLDLPYKNNEFSMIVILPKKRYGILEIEQKFTPELLRDFNRSKEWREVVLSLPRFKIESQIAPREQIVKMGYPLMFSDDANFSGISKSDSLKVDNIVHKTFIEIDEKKTVSAAASLTEMVIIGNGGTDRPRPEPKIFTADHPFVFFIIENRSQAILFTGRFVR